MPYLISSVASGAFSRMRVRRSVTTGRSSGVTRRLTNSSTARLIAGECTCDACRVGTLYLVATPIGNLEDVSPRALKVLQEVHMVACEDTRHTQILLRRHEIRAKHLTSYNEFNHKRQVNVLVGQLDRGWDVALVSDAGTPALSDP